MSFDPRFPPKNRRSESLDVLVLEIRHADGTLTMDPNGMAKAVFTEPDKLLDLKPLDGVASVLSGSPAVIFRSMDLEISLAPDECLRLCAHALEPDEYFTLRDRYGEFYEIHVPDFFDAETGEAMQPRPVPERAQRKPGASGRA